MNNNINNKIILIDNKKIKEYLKGKIWGIELLCPKCKEKNIYIDIDEIAEDGGFYCKGYIKIDKNKNKDCNYCFKKIK